MNELIDKFLFELFDGLRDKTTVLFGEFIADAQALAAIFMLLYFGVESFKMMSGDKKLEIIPLLRPFALGLVLMFWIPFINLISYPGELLTARSKAMFTNQIEEVELLSRNRYALIDSVAVELLHTSLEVERAENEVKLRLALEKIADMENIQPAEEEIDSQLQEVADANNLSLEDVKLRIPMDDFITDLRVTKAIEFVKENAVVDNTISTEKEKSEDEAAE